MASLPRELLNYAQFLRDSGYLYVEGPDQPSGKETGLPEQTVPPPSAQIVAAAEPRRRPSQLNTSEPDQADLIDLASARAPFSKTTLTREERLARIADARKRMESCNLCGLCEPGKKRVYGDGDVMAKIMFIGEAPGEEEDRQGIPFVGRAGQLLNKMIEAIGFKREEVYICNTLKCRPPNNRDPTPQEKKACEPHLIEQVDWIRPQMIIALGAHAAGYCTGMETSLGRMRKKWHTFHGIPVLCTYHPAFLLRSPGMKQDAWQDMLLIHARYCELNPDDPREVWRKPAAEPGA